MYFWWFFCCICMSLFVRLVPWGGLLFFLVKIHDNTKEEPMLSLNSWQASKTLMAEISCVLAIFLYLFKVSTASTVNIQITFTCDKTQLLLLKVQILCFACWKYFFYHVFLNIAKILKLENFGLTNDSFMKLHILTLFCNYWRKFFKNFYKKK